MTTRKRSVIGAMLLGLVAPGLGFMYAGKLKLAIYWYV